jgi:hypothetical protein
MMFLCKMSKKTTVTTVFILEQFALITLVRSPSCSTRWVKASTAVPARGAEQRERVSSIYCETFFIGNAAIFNGKVTQHKRFIARARCLI